jgi:OPA family sugar phosphate sensor protein UhpC-like MFS transporter
MQSELGFSKLELGFLSSVLYATYGASKFLSGILVDKSNPRYFISIGLILTGIFNLLFGMSSSLWFFAVFWGLNGLFQGWGWPGCVKLLTHWYSQSERGRWWSVLNTSMNIGGSLIPILVAACASHWGWRFAMYVPGLICILAGLFVMNRLRDTPQSLGLPPIEKYRNDYPNASSRREKSNLSTKELLFEYVIKNRFIWILAIAYFLIYVVRTAVNDWSMVYLMEMKGYTLKQAGFCLCWFEWGGLCGSLAAGWSSDMIFKGKRNPINVLFTLMMLVVLIAFGTFSHSSTLVDSMFIFLFGFFIFGPQMLIGMAAAELSHKNATATATGFVGCFAYLGAAVAGGPLGAITQKWGWDIYLLTLSICCGLGVLILLPLWSVKTNPKEEAAATTAS